MHPTFLALAVVILLFSVIVHEVMHGLAALYYGDHTAQRAGRLTLNPIPHIDPVGTILLPLLLILPAVLSGTSPSFIFGWAKPVPVNPFNFRDIRLGELIVSAAGVLANIALALLAVIIIKLAGNWINLIASQALFYAIKINLFLAFFNLLPIPPLDGSKVLASLLPPNLAASYQNLERYGFLILILLLVTPVGNILFGIMNFLISSIIYLLLG